MTVEQLSDRPLCACGCGRPVSVVMRNDSTRGLKKGQFRKYATLSCRNPRVLAVVDETRVCTTCRATKALSEFVRNSQATAGYGRYCKECDQVKRRARRLKKANAYGDKSKKTPPYEVLKTLYLGSDGNPPLTYEALARKFKVNPRTLRNTFIARAKRRGEWPLLTPAENERRRIAGVYAAKSSLPTTVGIAFVIEEYLERENLTRRQFAERFDFTYSYITTILAPGYKKPIDVVYAMRLLEACDEPVPPELKRLAQESIRKRKSNRKRNERRARLNVR